MINGKKFNSLCERWGDKVALELKGDHAWDRNNIIAGIFEGSGSGRPGHRILCREMTGDEQRVQRGFLRLSKGLQKAFATRYVLPGLKQPRRGTFWDRRAMAHELDLSLSAFDQRVKRAKSEIKRFQFDCTNIQ